MTGDEAVGGSAGDRRCVLINLLPDREPATVATWLARMP